jgi:murein tripeptide amidase MpaA
MSATAVAGSTAQAGGELAPLPFDHLMYHKEMSALLEQWAVARPQLMELESLGLTPEGREMWFITLTNRATGPALDKPAILVDGNTHASEGAGGVAALHFAWRLLSSYGSDNTVTRLLDTRTVYILPRLSPDGVDAVLASGRFIRSVNRPYPEAEPAPGLHMRDVDGDKRVVFMRFRDPNGPWKQHPDEPRLMVARGIDEVGGTYWRVLPEGMVEGYDGVTIDDPPAVEGLDLGTNYPGDRGAGPRSGSAGDYPTSEPEVAAYVAAVFARLNIVAHVTCHTFGGLILTPPVNVGEHLPASDRRNYDTLSGLGAKLTGYTAMSYLDLRGENSDAYIPSAFGWLWGQLGIISYITEFWNPLAAAGISLEGTTASAWLWGFHPVEDELKLLRWSDQELGGRAFVEWHAFDHPQLGPVEIGGWDKVGFFYNVPFERLEAEVAPHSEWLILHTLALPQLAVRSLSAEDLGNELWRVRLVLENRGWLPTNGSQQALDQGVVGGVEAEISLPDGARLAGGELRQHLGNLAGRSDQRSTATWWSFVPGTPDRGVVDWLLVAPKGTTILVTARHPRAGTVRGGLVLGAP